MSVDLEKKLVVGVSSRALFDMSRENAIFEKEGAESFVAYEREHEEEILSPGPGFPLIRALLRLNELTGDEAGVEVIVMSRNSPDSSLRVFRSIEHYGLAITRAALVSGASAGIICDGGLRTYDGEREEKQIRIAFDGDAVLFSDDSERLFREKGLEAFEENEKRNAKNPLSAGPFAKFLKTLSNLQRRFPSADTKQSPIRTALVTSRCAPAHERVLRTLRAWDVRIDEAFFMGGVSKQDVLRAFGADIFFDDQEAHTLPASAYVPAARVPWTGTADKEARARDP